MKIIFSEKYINDDSDILLENFMASLVNHHAFQIFDYESNNGDNLLPNIFLLVNENINVLFNVVDFNFIDINEEQQLFLS